MQFPENDKLTGITENANKNESLKTFRCLMRREIIGNEKFHREIAHA